MARYKKLTAPEEILYDLDETEFSIWFRWLLAIDSEPQVLTDYCFAWMLSPARRGTCKKLVPLKVESCSSARTGKPLERFFGCEITLGSSRNAILFRADDSQTPFATRNLELLDLLARFLGLR